MPAGAEVGGRVRGMTRVASPPLTSPPRAGGPVPEKSLANISPLLILVVTAAMFGVVAQIGVTLALNIARSRRQFLGFVLLSLVFSGGITVILAKMFSVDPVVAATFGAMAGAVPSLITLRLGLKAVASKYSLDAQDELKQLEERREQP